jgi:hypothetical protein
MLERESDIEILKEQMLAIQVLVNTVAARRLVCLK